jgi:preprotein translocase subunit SecF
MHFFKPDINYDFMGKQKFFITLSIILNSAAVIALFVIGPKFGIEFLGGTEMQVRFKQSVDASDVRQSLGNMGFPNAEVVAVGQGEKEYMIRLESVSSITEEKAAAARKIFEEAFKGSGLKKFTISPGGDRLAIHLTKDTSIADVERAAKDAGLNLGAVHVDETRNIAEEEGGAEKKTDTSKKCQGSTCSWQFQNQFVYEVSLKGVTDKIIEGLQSESFGQGVERLRSEWVGPKVGKQLRDAATWSVIYAMIFIMIYVGFRFDIRFAPGGVVALAHDVLIILGVFVIFRIQFTMNTVAALLTIVGYSIMDTIVVYDRIRENLSKIKGRELITVINGSINQTLGRTVNTSLVTLLVIVALLTIGWKTSLRDFALALFVGVVTGTYSSIFIASPVTAWIDRRFFKKTE